MRDADGLDVTVNAGSFAGIEEGMLEHAVRGTLKALNVEEAEISLTLLDDEGIRAMNRAYLAKDRPTDVIAFTLGRPGQLLGDVYVGMEQARRQATELGVPLEEELVRLTVHGTLHVLGHDHPEGAERDTSPMWILQEELVRRIRT